MTVNPFHLNSSMSMNIHYCDSGCTCHPLEHELPRLAVAPGSAHTCLPGRPLTLPGRDHRLCFRPGQSYWEVGAKARFSMKAAPRFQTAEPIAPRVDALASSNPGTRDFHLMLWSHEEEAGISPVGMFFGETLTSVAPLPFPMCSRQAQGYEDPASPQQALDWRLCVPRFRDGMPLSVKVFKRTKPSAAARVAPSDNVNFVCFFTNQGSCQPSRQGNNLISKKRLAAAPTNCYHFRLVGRSEEHTSELQSRQYLVCRLLLEKKKIT